MRPERILMQYKVLTIILYQTVVSEMLRKPKTEGGDPIKIVRAETTLELVCEVNLSLYIRSADSYI